VLEQGGQWTHASVNWKTMVVLERSAAVVVVSERMRLRASERSRRRRGLFRQLDSGRP